MELNTKDLLREQNALLAQLVNGQQTSDKAVAAAHTGTLLHGPGGMFNTPGLSSGIISLHVRSKGLGQLRPAFPSNETNPFYGFITGFGAEAGDEPVNPCDAAPTGYMKSGTLTAKFGHVARDTKTIRLPDTIKKLNRGDFTDLNLINSVLSPDSTGIYYPNDLNEQGLLDMVTKAEMVIAGINMERKLSTLLWTGDATVSTAQEGYVEFPGLDNQIATGQVDAELNSAMPSADSLILNFGYQDVTQADIVEPIEEAEDYVFNLAEDTGLSVEGVFVMRPQAWRAISSVWPIQYNTQPDMATIAGSEARVIIDGRTNIQERDAMRQGLYLDVNGRRFGVVLDTGIVELDNDNANLDADEFASSVYFVPLRAANMPVTYWEYLNHQLSVPQTQLLRGMETWYTDGGRFLWSYDGQYTCFNLKMETDPRVVLRTPHLAFKIQNVKYRRSYAPLRSDDPASSYWKDGGVSIRNISPTQYATWL